jgi:hypothetical protein
MVTNKDIDREFEAGWYSLYDSLIVELDDLPCEIKIKQAKEKFALLRVYYTIDDKYKDYRDKVDAIIDKYVQLSERTCIDCGSQEAVKKQYIHGYLVTICDDCYSKHKDS